MERILPPARGVSSIGSTVGDAVVPVAESPPNLPLQAALVNDLCSVQNGRERSIFRSIIAALMRTPRTPKHNFYTSVFMLIYDK